MRGRPTIGAHTLDASARVLAFTAGPLLRRLGPVDRTFVDRSWRSHNETMLALPPDHWVRLIRKMGLTGYGAVLDVGCGVGAWLGPLAKLNGRIVGVDIDDDALKIASTAFADHRNVEIKKLPAETLDFASQSFDAVSCLGVLPYVQSAQVVSEMGRVLRPGGALVLGTPGVGYYLKSLVEGARAGRPDAVRYGIDPIMVGTLRTLRVDKLAVGSLRSWTPRAVRRLLEANGLIVDRVVVDVEPAYPGWPTTFLGAPVYFIVYATKA